MKQPNFAIVGQFAAGKTTLADKFVSLGYTRVSLAGRLKAIAADAFNGGNPIEKSLTYSMISEDDSVRHISGRQVLQELGQSVKALDRDFWIRLLTHDIKAGAYGAGPFVCDDCRFPYEADALRRIGFTIAKVETSEAVRADRYKSLYGRLPTQEELSHPSETQVLLIRPDVRVSGVIDPYDAVAELLGVRAA